MLKRIIEFLVSAALRKYRFAKSARMFKVGIIQVLLYDNSVLRLDELLAIASGDYDGAKIRHIRHNKHHWEYWIIPSPSDSAQTKKGLVYICQMPEKHVRVMLCDWFAVAEARDATEFSLWLDDLLGRFTFHPSTAQVVAHILQDIGCGASTWVLLGGRLN